jgi:zinc protease
MNEQATTSERESDKVWGGLPSGVQHLRTIPFGKRLVLETFGLDNGLKVLLIEDHSAKIVAYHTWFRVGSRHEQVGKTGIAHLFEHLMFNETKNLPKGEFDRRLEEAGAESNASTWLDFTQYSISAPSSELDLLVNVESERMQHLVLRDAQVSSEKEVVANERRYRVDDDVEGAVNELLWSTAMNAHSYRWPTIGWMEDIQGFTTEDCERFYAAYYSPNNAAVVIVGDIEPRVALQKIVEKYGAIPRAEIPLEDVQPEPHQTTERRVEVNKPTPTEKLTIGYRAPSLGDFDHVPLGLLGEVLAGGRASRLYKRLVRDLELASDVRLSLGPFRDPGLLELYVSAREGVTAEQLLEVVDAEFEAVCHAPPSNAELDRAKARSELGLLHGLETVDGKAQTLGFYECVLGQPHAAFERLEALLRTTPSDVLRVARRYLVPEARSVIFVRSSLADAEEDGAEDEVVQ